MDDLAYFPPGTETYVGCLASGLRVRWYERGPRSGAASGAAAGAIAGSAAGAVRGSPTPDPELPTVLCLHGFPELAVSWREQLDGLSSDYRVVAPDMRGYGGTDAPERVRDYSLDLLVQDVVELIDALGVEKVHLVGHDWGGVIAWEVGQRHGDRLHTLSVLNCPPLQVMARGMLDLRQLRRSWYMFFFQLPVLPERYLTRDPSRLLDRMFRGSAYNPEPFTRERMAPYLRQLRDRGVPGINYYRAAVRRLPRALTPIRVPTRLIWGLRDTALSSDYADPAHYCDWVEHFDRVLIEDASHWVQQEAPEAVNRALREHFEPVEPVDQASGRAQQGVA